VLELESGTSTPPFGAGPFIFTVAVEFEPSNNFDGEGATAVDFAGGLMVSVAVLLTPKGSWL